MLKQENTSSDYKLALPDGTELEMKKISDIIENIFFFPKNQGIEFLSFSEQITHILSDVSFDLKKPLSKNIILSGGNSLIQGFTKRIGMIIIQRKGFDASNARD